MSSYWFTYKPFSKNSPLGMHEAELKKIIQEFRTAPQNTTKPWRVSAHKKIKVGDYAYLYKQGSAPCGIFGVGTVCSDPLLNNEGNPDKKKFYSVDIKFSLLVDPSEAMLISKNDLKSFVPDALFNTQSSGIEIEQPIADEIRHRVRPQIESIQDNDLDETDCPTRDQHIAADRHRILRAIADRRGQAAFRKKLLAAYDMKCALTNCPVKTVLEAAHIIPYCDDGIDQPSNGILLRADLHTLYDYHLFAIEPDSRRIVISHQLRGTVYEELENTKLRIAIKEEDRPHTVHLKHRYQLFLIKNNIS